MSFGNLLREARQARGLTLRQLAQGSGLSYGYLGLVEREVRIPPRREVVEQLADLYGVDFGLLLAEVVSGAARENSIELFRRYSGQAIPPDPDQVRELAHDWLSLLGLSDKSSASPRS